MRRILGVLSGTVVIVCALSQSALAQRQQGEREQQASTTTRSEVESFVRSRIDAWNRVDGTALSSALSHRAGVTWLYDGFIMTGWEEIRALNDSMKAPAEYQLGVGTMDIVSLGPDYVLVVAPDTATRRYQELTMKTYGSLTLVLAKEQDGWKIVHEHFGWLARP